MTRHGEDVQVIQVDVVATVPSLGKLYALGMACLSTPGTRAQDDADVIAAMGVVVMFLWDRAWGEAGIGVMTMELACLNSTQTVTADVNPLPDEVVVNVARTLLAEA